MGARSESGRQILRWHHQHALLKHVGFHVDQKLLLWPEDASRPANPAPPNETARRKPEVLHGEQSDQRTSAAQPGFAVHSAWAFLGLNDVKEPVDDFPWRASAVRKVEIGVLDSFLGEALLVIGAPVEAYHQADTRIQENWHIVIRSEGWVTVLIDRFGTRPCKCQKPIRQHPIRVSIFNPREKVVGLNVEALRIEKTTAHAVLNAL
mmetsp:Transcript_44108/g.122127  ORF Transcript_44108/g.122127 Transcript_44108/m.122127 type:complete len:207 (-) Transcript_44108:451-1071(-)